MSNDIAHLFNSEQIKKGFLSTTIYFLSNSLSKMVPIVLMPILTRLLTTADYGVVGIFNALGICVNSVVSVGGTGAVARAYYDRKDAGFDFPAYIFNAILVNAVLFIVAILIFTSIYILGIIEISLGVVIAAFLLTVATVLSGYKTKLWILQEKAMSYSVFDFSRTVLNVLLSLFLVYFLFRDWSGRVLGILITDILFSFISCILLFKEDGIKFVLRQKYISDVLKFGIPLIPFAIGWAFVSTADRLMLKYLLGDSSVGIYTVAFTLSTSMLLIVIPLDNTLFPHIYKMYSENKMETKVRFVYGFYIYSIALTAIAFFITVISPFLLRFLAGESFRSASNYVFWVLMSQVFLGMNRTANRGIFFVKKTYYAAISVFAAGLVAIVANYLLIQINGINGAGQATFISCGVLFVMNFIFCQKLYPMPWLSLTKIFH
ncbi:MAG: oligosaccharide flippase family protein [Deltaproteobacteria bacterium]|nr:oligosaccharide flippase family protein [Deltaproteobacteria bacterium]